MLHIKSVKPVSDYKIWIAFDDGTEGQVDLHGRLDGPILRHLKTKKFFPKLQLIPSLRLWCGPMVRIWLQSF